MDGVIPPVLHMPSWYVQGGEKAKVHPCTGTEALYRPYGP